MAHKLVMTRQVRDWLHRAAYRRPLSRGVSSPRRLTSFLMRARGSAARWRTGSPNPAFTI